MKNKIFMILAVCVACACIPFSACASGDTTNETPSTIRQGTDEVREEEPAPEQPECPDCKNETKPFPRLKHPPEFMPEFRFAPPPADGGRHKETAPAEDGVDVNSDGNAGESPSQGHNRRKRTLPKHYPDKKIKPEMPRKKN